MTSRWGLLARQIANGTQVTSGDRVSVFLTDVHAAPAVEAFVEECSSRGATVQVLLTDEKYDLSALRHATDEQLTTPPALEEQAMRWSTVHVSFRGMATPTGALDQRRVALQRKGKGIISALRWENTRWCLVRVPTREWAELIGVPPSQLEEEFFAGCLDDWAQVDEKQHELCDALNRSTWMQVTTPDTNLRCGTAGRTWVSFAGEMNLPDGEVATAPLDHAVEGFITFPGTFWFSGVSITNLRLVFEAGRVVDVSADEGEEFARHMVSSDGGSDRVGELGVGTNRHVSTFTGDLLIDEKILGTMHLALGRAYPECGGVNQSSIHWDIVKDLRHPGASLTTDVGDLIVDGVVTGLLEPLA